MLTVFVITIALAEPPECPATASSAAKPPVLDVWTGTLDTKRREDEGVATVPAPAPTERSETSVSVDESWPGEVVPELRSTPVRALKRKLGPPTADRAAHLAWDAPYGCLVLEVEAGAVAVVGVHHRPCPAVLAEIAPPR